MPLYWAALPMLRASHATTTFRQQAAGAEDWTACADPVCFVEWLGGWAGVRVECRMCTCVQC
jgi:hypothetical protein